MTGDMRACRLPTVALVAVVIRRLASTVTVQLVPRPESELAFAGSETEGVLERTVVVVVDIGKG